MKDMGIVCGSETQAKPVVVGVDTVYEHTDITQVTEPDEQGNIPEGLFRYHEYQYTKDEYIDKLMVQNEENNRLMNTILGVNE